MASRLMHPKMGYSDHYLKSNHMQRSYISDPYLSRNHRPPSLSRPQSQRRMDSPATSNGTSNSQRRRIALACIRCRKRKIRCSGDPGDRSGCTNCKSAAETDHCQFLRVSSTAVDLGSMMPSHSTPSQSISHSMITIPTAPPSTNFYQPPSNNLIGRSSLSLGNMNMMYSGRNSYDQSDSSHPSLADHAGSMGLYNSSAYNSTRSSISSDALQGDISDGNFLHSASQEHSPGIMFPGDSGTFSRQGDLSLRPTATRSDSSHYDTTGQTSNYNISPLAGSGSRDSSVASFADYNTYSSAPSLSSHTNSIPPEKVLGSNDLRFPLQLPQPSLNSMPKYTMDAPKVPFNISALSSYNSGSSAAPYNGWNTDSYSSVPYNPNTQKSSSGYASTGSTDQASQQPYPSSYGSNNSAYGPANSAVSMAPSQARSTGSPETVPSGSNANGALASSPSNNEQTPINAGTPSRDTTTSYSLDLVASTPSISVGK